MQDKMWYFLLLRFKGQTSVKDEWNKRKEKGSCWHGPPSVQVKKGYVLFTPLFSTDSVSEGPLPCWCLNHARVCVCVFHPLDVAVGCPFGGEERGGRVLIFNGNRDVSTRGLTLSQELRAAGTPSGSLPGFGFTLRGGQDLDNNQYPGKHSTDRSLPAQLPPC